MMMKRMGAWMLLALLTLAGEWHGRCYGCMEEESIGLLEIQSLIDPHGFSLGDWVGSSNCCEWYGIQCDNTTRRVIQVSLFGTRDESLGHWVLNASLFLPFKELQSLELGRASLVGCLENEGFEVLSSKLRELGLSENRFNKNDKSILSCFNGNLSTLESLDLSYNGLTAGSGRFYGFKVLSSRLKKLENLHLGGNQYNDSIFSSLTEFSSLKSLDLSYNQLTGSINSFQLLPMRMGKLENLDLGGNRLNSSILSILSGLSSLKSLDLSRNMFTGSGWCELKNLKQLDLSRNNLGGSLPDCLGNLSSLQLLDVSKNQFTGNIAFGPLTNLTSLEFLSLSNNFFEVPISMKPFMNHSSLKFFCNENNKLVTEPAVFEHLIPKFQLVFFSVSKTTEALNVQIPNFLYYQYHLRFLDLSHNNITGMFPSWLLNNNTRLEQLYLSGNSFVGTLQLQEHPYPKMTELDISNNNMTGQIPKDICLIFPNLESLRMAKNGFTGCIPSCLGNISSLSLLDLSNNQLSTVTLELLTLQYLKLSNNNLGGQIPTSVFNSSVSEYLYLGDNNFWGQISYFPLNGWKSWIVVDLSNNQFSGMLPRGFVNSTNLEAIDLSKNHFKGPIPRDFCKLDQVQYLILSDNNLSGYIPSCFSPPSIIHMHLSKNRLSGPLTYGFYNSSSLVTMDLRDNNFTGSIPNWIGNLSSLSVLLMKANHFDGELPVQLCLLEQLSILDVSQNQLSGPLPSCLGNLTFKESSQKALVNLGVLLLPRSIEKAYYETMGPPVVASMYTLLKGYWPNFTEEVVEFTTKNMYYGYKGKILSYMSGFDLSNNNFVGAIPPEFGNLSEILSLNLSHNNLTGSIPATFSNLKRIESLDLSYNNLNGVIPPQLTEITTLEVFSVAHNNLSGKTPERKYQFGTFNESCYEGNPFLCGPPLRNKCCEEAVPSQPVPNDEQGDDGFIDMEFFYISFGVCYTVVVMTIAAVLYINPYWRRRWLYFIEDCIDTCYYFVVASFRKFPQL
ncbi:PREDICTED: LRR receptor-like serine/threonine-protein kinase GSO1 isoform X4 [Populus euphratica]|uniref:LRR receptor-like serine/threonine-protein kinase GSO1 isoform X4 n=1 Tax=Populus euphratica TaxID=75702 RepID=A0AAJ6TF45_POPEU|nr:PREDICTED: LRR receptor-like serine/threonine-protein kinase GSO1 isoform X4 [Populus euphratica]